MSDTLVANLRRGGLEPLFINPSGREMYGSIAYPTLLDMPAPVDLAFVITPAGAVPGVLEQSRRAGCGGALVVSSGFADLGATSLVEEFVHAAGEMPVIGPNCTGYVNLLDGVLAYSGPLPDLASGGLGVVSHSGALLTHLAVALAERRLGAGILVSAGNETVTSVPDLLDAMVSDPRIAAIALIIETDRGPGRFLESLAAASAAGKPVVCLKLGRSHRAAAIAQSHTGAIAGDRVIFDAALRSCGALLASDLEELLDYVSPFVQLDRSFWSAARDPAS